MEGASAAVNGAIHGGSGNAGAEVLVVAIVSVSIIGTIDIAALIKVEQW